MQQVLSKYPHFMIMPSLACPATCSYCFGPHQGPIMTEAMLITILDYMATLVVDDRPQKIKVTFHGGEPLVAGHAFWTTALEGLSERFGKDGFKTTVQSNLWLFDKQFAELFQKYSVHIGTSLDGPEWLTDKQRGKDYFQKTMTGVHLARQYGIQPGAIATFTPTGLPYWKEVMHFFKDEKLNMITHPSVQQLGNPNTAYTLSPDDYGALLNNMLAEYVQQRKHMRSSSLDQLVQAVSTGKGSICTYQDCLGMFLAIDPDGGIYPCQRFAGQKEFRLGQIEQQPTFDQLMSSPMARQLKEREVSMAELCHTCSHYGYCKGGCAYNALAEGSQKKDPYCDSYKKCFDTIQQKLLLEMTSSKNIHALTAGETFDEQGHGLLRKGPLTELINRKSHPMSVARHARRIIAAVEYARSTESSALEDRLVAMGICRSKESAQLSLQDMKNQLHPTSHQLNNLYIHTTFRCQLACDHCYAHASNELGYVEMTCQDIEKLILEAHAAGFRQVILTGGEPLFHREAIRILEMCRTIRSQVKPMNLVLRTNFSLSLDKEQMQLLAEGFDQLVVSLDGDRVSHNKRRGNGQYDAVLKNINSYQISVAIQTGSAELSLATVLKSESINGPEGHHVRKLAKQFRIKRIRFRPLLPLGRAEQQEAPLVSEALGMHLEPQRFVEAGFKPVASCGLGKNLYIEPNGDAFPCYAFHKPHSVIGNVIQENLAQCLQSEFYQNLVRHTVDTNIKCKTCDVRYLCGGACRAWGREKTQYDLDASPPECDGLFKKAVGIYEAAKNYLAE